MKRLGLCALAALAALGLASAQVGVPGHGSLAAAFANEPHGRGVVTVAQIQGTGSTSPFAGQLVTTTGVVTARKSNGYFLQMPGSGDGDPASSDGILVFTSSAPPASAAVGALLQVTGTVTEFRPSSDQPSPPLTELSFPQTPTVLGTAALPAAVTLTASDFEPEGGIEQLERYEGMRVHLARLTVVGPTGGSVTETTASASSNGVFFGVISGVARPFREPGIEEPEAIPPPTTPQPCCPPRFDGNPERLRVDSNAQAGAFSIDVTSGATVTNITGPLDYAFRSYTLLPDPLPVPAVTGNRSATPVPAPSANELTVAAFNLARYFDDVDDPGTGEPVLTATAFSNRQRKASLAIRNVLRTPDVLAVVEVENLGTLQRLAAQISDDALADTQADPGYQSFLVEGNDIGGIDVGFLVKSPKISVLNLQQENKDETFVDPSDGSVDTLNDRPPLRLDASVQTPGGDSFLFTVIAVHQRSLNSVNADVLNPGSASEVNTARRVREKRRKQAESLATLVQTRQIEAPDSPILVVGDFNAFQFNDGYVDAIATVKGQPTAPDEVVLASPDLVEPDLTDLVDLVTPAEQRYSYTFGGNAQVLDHILVTQGLLSRIRDIQHARVDADFPVVYYGDPGRPERISDHDPPVVYILLDPPAATPTATPSPSVPPGPSATPTPGPLDLPGQDPRGTSFLLFTLLAIAIRLPRRPAPRSRRLPQP